jgi:hypothetical protein
MLPLIGWVVLLQGSVLVLSLAFLAAFGVI